MNISIEINQFVNEEKKNITKRMELATKYFLDEELEKRFMKVLKDLEDLERR